MTDPMFLACCNVLLDVLPKELIQIITHYAQRLPIQLTPHNLSYKDIFYLNVSESKAEFHGMVIGYHSIVQNYRCLAQKPISHYLGCGLFEVKCQVLYGNVYFGFETKETKSCIEIRPNEGFFQFRKRRGGKYRFLKPMPTCILNWTTITIVYNTCTQQLLFYSGINSIGSIQYSLEPLDQRYFYITLLPNSCIEIVHQ
jgi:hypothetical protein